jgi:hypothetical protein
MLKAGTQRLRFPMRSLSFLKNLPNASGRNMTLGLTQPLRGGVKRGRCVSLTNSSHTYEPIFRDI